YAALGKILGPEAERDGRIDLRFVMMTTPTYLYLDKNRPVPGSDAFEVSKADDCPQFNNYRFGLEHRPPHLERIAAKDVRDNLFRRKLVLMIGAEDTNDDYLDKTCGAMIQGPNRFERASSYWKYIQRFPEWRENVRFEVVPGVGLINDQHYHTVKPIAAALFGPFRPSNPALAAPSPPSPSQPPQA